MCHAPGTVFYLVFVSAAKEMISDGELVSLLEAARSHNSSRGITGLLLYYEGCFIEIMEGPQEVVEWVFDEKNIQRSAALPGHEAPDRRRAS